MPTSTAPAPTTLQGGACQGVWQHGCTNRWRRRGERRGCVQARRWRAPAAGQLGTPQARLGLPPNSTWHMACCAGGAHHAAGAAAGAGSVRSTDHGTWRHQGACSTAVGDLVAAPGSVGLGAPHALPCSPLPTTPHAATRPALPPPRKRRPGAQPPTSTCTHPFRLTVLRLCPTPPPRPPPARPHSMQHPKPHPPAQVQTWFKMRSKTFQTACMREVWGGLWVPPGRELHPSSLSPCHTLPPVLATPARLLRWPGRAGPASHR